MKIKSILSRTIRDRRLYSLWSFLNRLSFYGMNYEVASGYADYSGELHVIRSLKKYLSTIENAIVFDIGANVGDWSKFAIDEYSDLEYSLYMFEPAQNTFDRLISNISASTKNKFFKLAFGDSIGESVIYYDYDMQGSASILNDQNFGLSEKIKIDTLTNFCKQECISKINFLKMDVQGYEYNVLIGAKEMIETHNIDIIQFEFDSPNIENKVYFKDFYQLLCNDYYIYKILYNGFVKIEEYNYKLENYMCLNYLAVRKNCHLELDTVVSS